MISYYALFNALISNLAVPNRAIAALLPGLNERPFKKLPGSRRALYEQLDRPALKSLPAQRSHG